MAQTVTELEADGLISRHPDPGDARRATLKLTKRGRGALEADRRQREGWLIGAIEDGFTPQEQQTLEQAVPLLRRLAEM
jgi:DNA-binding MarR family transcriptional regulator